MVDQDRIRDKIRGMLLKAKPGSGATEAEASSAMAAAMAMMARHNIQMNMGDLDEAQPRQGSFTERMDYMKWHLFCAEAAAYLYTCRVTIRRSNDGYAFNWVGRPDNIDACEMTYLWLVDQVEALYKQNLPPGLSKSTRAELRRTFKLACAARIRGRAWRLLEAMASDDTLALASTGSTALVVKTQQQQMFAEADELLKDNRKLATRPSKAGIGTQIGLMAGDSVQLNKAMAQKRLQLEDKR